MDDTYRVLRSSFETEIKVKGSRFIARAEPVDSPDEAGRILEGIRRRFHDATHHTSAWRLGPTGEEFRFNDDGEPAGTAGKPILRQIDGHGLTNTMVVVTRYFGGTKLGTGGLIRAYGDAARETLDRADVKTLVLRTNVTVQFPYSDTSPAMHAIDRFDAKIEKTDYGDETKIKLRVRRSDVMAFVEAFTNGLSGRGRVEVDEPD